MARMKYAERKKLATEWEHYCKVTGLLPTTERFVDWLERVRGLVLLPQNSVAALQLQKAAGEVPDTHKAIGDIQLTADKIPPSESSYKGGEPQT